MKLKAWLKNMLKYVGPVKKQDGETDKDVTNTISCGLPKWRLASWVLYEQHSRLKEKLYTSVVRPVMLYKAEFWASKNTYEQQLHVAEIWMCEITRKGTVNNKNIK